MTLLLAEPALAHGRFFTVESLGENRHLTNEGFLVCTNVPIARTGRMLYGPGETSIPPGRDGIAVVVRDSDVVFAPETIASFEGKPVTNNHPTEDVTPRNWQALARGVVQNVRRGVPPNDDFLIADLMIYDADTIRAILSGKCEVSCGYDADYEVIEPGLGRQVKIVGNHVAIVESGRCGPMCAIRDENSLISEDSQMTKHVVPQVPLKTRFADRLRDAFLAQDHKSFDEALREMEADPSAPNIAVHIHQPGGSSPSGANGPAGDAPAGDPAGNAVAGAGASPPGGPNVPDAPASPEDILTQIMDILVGFGQRLAVLEEAAAAAVTGPDMGGGMGGGMAPTGEPAMPPAGGEDGPAAAAPGEAPTEGGEAPTDDPENPAAQEAPEGEEKKGPPAEEDEEGKEPPAEEKKEKTEDAAPDPKIMAALAGEWQQTLSLAEIITPGVSLPTFDAKLAPEKARDAMCAFRRNVLEKAFTTEDGKRLITPYLFGETEPKFSTMTCDAVSVLFTAAGQAARARNHVVPSTMRREQPKQHGISPAEINRRNAEYWSRK